MKTIFALLTAIMMVLLGNPHNLYAQSRENDNVISQKKSKRMMNKKDVVLLDVRTTEEYNEGHIPGALHIDVQQPDFTSSVLYLDKNKKYILYCRTGKRSANALEIMKQNGFENVHNMKGGFSQWKGPID